MGIGRISESTVDVEIEFISGDGYFMDKTDITNLGRKTIYSNNTNAANLKVKFIVLKSVKYLLKIMMS